MFNLVFQSEDTTLHLHYRLAENLFETILRYYMQSDYVDAFKNGKFNQINPSESDQYLPLKVNIGEEKDNHPECVYAQWRWNKRYLANKIY